MKRILIFLLFITYAAADLSAKVSQTVIDFRPVADSLSVLMKERTTVDIKLKIKNVARRGDALDFTFSETLGDYPWHSDDIQWFRRAFKDIFPEQYSGCHIGEIYVKNRNIIEYAVAKLTSDGKPYSDAFRVDDDRYVDIPLVSEVGGMNFPKGLSDRYIALWQSHGLYHDVATGRWQWQRPPLFSTVEDLYTQSYVLPFLVPMLENAGAYVLLPRERDCSTVEVITHPQTGGSGKGSTVWKPEIPQRGRFALYVTYRSVPESSSKVRYTIHHLGGKTEFDVNQKMGGGLWIYLGTFDFPKGDESYVTMENLGPDGSVANAGNLKIGGGIGVSGHPRFVEGAKYWMQYSGVDQSVWNQNNGQNDYRDDFMSRGAWVSYLSAGSKVNPGKFLPPLDGLKNQPPEREGLHIPIDLSFGFHSDAGLFQRDTIVGTLAIYTLLKDGKDVLPDGEKRICQREYADAVQSQVVNDVRACFNPQWSRRGTWDRSYSESRTPSVPAMLLELLSHQNFEDMKYGLDPSFRFTVSRAVYKGMLKFLSNRFGCPYTVQPLPVNSFTALLEDGRVKLSWRETPDSLEPTAVAKSYIVYRRIDDGAFDKGREVDGNSMSDDIKPGHIYSYKVVAVNDGGRSFPSEILAVGIPENAGTTDRTLVVNNFTRVGGPEVLDTQEYAGFDTRRDGGVPYIKDISYIGDMYEWHRDAAFISNDNPGFGASYTDWADKVVAGNTFDYVYMHGKAIMDAGMAFCSSSASAFSRMASLPQNVRNIDLICGKQRSTKVGHSHKYTVFTDDMMSTIRDAVTNGVNILVSGSDIATDADNDPLSKSFVREVLGFKLASGFGSRSGQVQAVEKSRSGSYSCKVKSFAYNNRLSDKIYCVETPDGIAPSGKKSRTIYRYADSGISAGVCVEQASGSRVLSLGFPIETVTDPDAFEDIISSSLKYFERK